MDNLGPRTRNVLKDDISVEPPARKYVTIDVLCKEFTMLFAKNVKVGSSKKRGPSLRRTIKKPTSKYLTNGTYNARRAAKAKATDTDNTVLSSIGNTLSSHYPLRKKPGVLGTPDMNAKTDVDSKGGKRKRLVKDDIAAENIPLESVFPPLQFGINKDLCPKKKRRLQSLIAPESAS